MTAKRCQASVAATGIPEVDVCNTRLVDGECPNHPHKPVTEKTPIGTIDLTPSWTAIGTIYLEVLMDSSSGSNAKAAARSEIMRALMLADLYVKETKP